MFTGPRSSNSSELHWDTEVKGNLVNYPCGIDDEFITGPPVHISAVTWTLGHVPINRIYSKNCQGTSNFVTTILFVINCDVDNGFQSVVFCRLAKIIAEDVIENKNRLRRDVEKWKREELKNEEHFSSAEQFNKTKKCEQKTA